MRTPLPRFVLLTLLVWVSCLAIGSAAQDQANSPAAPAVPDEFAIGIGDKLSIRVWKNPDASGDVVVRPDGKISLPLINEVAVAGLTPGELRVRIAELLSEFLDSPSLEVVVTEVNSRKVFIMGEVNRPAEYPLLAPTTVLQLISMAGGVTPYADTEHITVIRGNDFRPDGTPWSYEVNLKQIMRRQNLEQNTVWLKPGDTVIVR